jgi:hypothetical protein
MVFVRGLFILLILNSALLAQKKESRSNVPDAAFEDLHHNLLELESLLIHSILNVSDTAFEERLHQNLLEQERVVKNFAKQVEEEMQVEKQRHLELQTALEALEQMQKRSKIKPNVFNININIFSHLFFVIIYIVLKHC